MNRILLVRFRKFFVQGIMNPECSSSVTRYIPLKHISYVDVNHKDKTVDIVFEGEEDKLTLTQKNCRNLSKQVYMDLMNDESYVQVKEEELYDEV